MGGAGCWLLVGGFGLGIGLQVGVEGGVGNAGDGDAVLFQEERECFAAGFGFGFGGFGSGGLGDGSDGAEVGVEDDVVDEVFWIVGVIGRGRAGGVQAGGAAGSAAGAARGRGARIAGEIAAGDEEAVEEAARALVVELVAGDEGEDLGEGELDAGVVVDGGDLEFSLVGVDSTVARSGAAGGVVVVAEVLAAQGWRAAAAARGVDVAAEITLDGDVGEFGCGFGWVGHRCTPFVYEKSLKSSKEVR